MSIRDEVRYALDAASWARERARRPLDPWHERLLREEPKRVLLNVHRQGGKSHVASLAISHAAIYRPFVQEDAAIVICSPSGRQSELLMKKARAHCERAGAVIQPSPFPDPGFHVPGGNSVVALPDDPSTTRGYTAGLLVIEEAGEVPDASFHTVTPFVGATGGRVIVLGTPHGARGWFWELCDGGRGGPAPGWEYVRALAKDCPRFSPEFLAEELRMKGRWWFAQEYEGAFVDTGAATFQPDVLTRVFQTDKEGGDLDV